MTFVAEYYFLILSLILAVILVFKLKKVLAIRAVHKSPGPHEFIFKHTEWSVLWIVIFIGSNALTQWDGWTSGSLLLTLLFAIYLAISLIYNREIIRLNPDSVTINDSREKVKVVDIVGVRITDNEITIHTKKHPNNHRLMAKDLIDTHWSEFQEAIIQYTGQFDHIDIERA